MGHKMALSFCVGDFYLIGKVDIDNLNIDKNQDGSWNINFTMCENDIKRIDDPGLENTKAEAKSNVLQINFQTGEKKWI
jgi:hypothetical protein